MSRWQMALVFSWAAAGCVDVPRAPRPVPAGERPSSDASAPGDAGRPVGPLPASDECVQCGAAQCFEQGAACVGDQTCQTCISDVLAPPCADNALFIGVIECVCMMSCRQPCLDICVAFNR